MWQGGVSGVSPGALRPHGEQHSRVAADRHDSGTVRISFGSVVVTSSSSADGSYRYVSSSASRATSDNLTRSHSISALPRLLGIEPSIHTKPDLTGPCCIESSLHKKTRLVDPPSAIFPWRRRRAGARPLNVRSGTFIADARRTATVQPGNHADSRCAQAFSIRRKLAAKKEYVETVNRILAECKQAAVESQ
jgi:hypothetical protein